MGWALYRDLRGVCADMGVHASVAGRLAPALLRLGVDSLAAVCEVDVADLREQYGVGRRSVEVARALGARGEGR